jgi:hypothetical protein
MKIKARDIDSLPPGSRVRLLDREWVRMTDWPERHISGALCDPASGEWSGWSSLCYCEDEIELIERKELT